MPSGLDRISTGPERILGLECPMRRRCGKLIMLAAPKNFLETEIAIACRFCQIKKFDTMLNNSETFSVLDDASFLAEMHYHNFKLHLTQHKFSQVKNLSVNAK